MQTVTRRQVPRRMGILLGWLLFTALLGGFARPAAADSFWVGRFWAASHIRIEVVGLHNSYAGPRVGNRNHINFNVYATARSWTVSGQDRKLANLHVSITDDWCLYIWDSQTGREWERCINWDNWNSASSGVSDAINGAIRDVSGVQIDGTWLYWLVASVVLWFLVALLLGWV